MEARIIFVAGANNDEDVPTVTAFAGENVKTTREAEKRYETTEYESAEYWKNQQGADAFYIEGDRLYKVVAGSSDATETGMEELLDRIKAGRGSKASKELQEWLMTAPSNAHLVHIQTEFPSNFRKDGFTLLSDSLFSGKLDRASSFNSAGTYLFPDESAQKHDEDLKALVRAVHVQENAMVTEIYHFSGEGKASDYKKLIERRLKSTRKDIEEGEIAGDKLVLDLEKLLENAQVEQDGSTTTFTYSIPQSVVLGAIRAD